MLSALQNMVSRLHILDVPSLRDICMPFDEQFYETQDSESSPYAGLKREDIGAIISVEPRMAAPHEPFDAWRLQSHYTEGIERHYTQLFYTDGNSNGARKDLFLSTNGPEIIMEKASALSDTLDFTDKFLHESNKKLVTHCIYGIHRSPALMVAILAHQYPEESSTNIIAAMIKTCLFTAPRLRKGEIAFVDAYFSRKGELIDTWHELGKDAAFDTGRSHDLRTIFENTLTPQRNLPTLPDRKPDELHNA